jgi:hypothetical protein
MTTMEKNSLAYSQIILLVALVSICAFLSSKSHHMHCWIPVMCHRAQTLSAAPHLSRSRNLAMREGMVHRLLTALKGSRVDMVDKIM